MASPFYFPNEWESQLRSELKIDTRWNEIHNYLNGVGRNFTKTKELNEVIAAGQKWIGEIAPTNDPKTWSIQSIEAAINRIKLWDDVKSHFDKNFDSLPEDALSASQREELNAIMAPLRNPSLSKKEFEFFEKIISNTNSGSIPTGKAPVYYTRLALNVIESDEHYCNLVCAWEIYCKLNKAKSHFSKKEWIDIQKQLHRIETGQEPPDQVQKILKWAKSARLPDSANEAENARCLAACLLGNMKEVEKINQTHVRRLRVDAIIEYFGDTESRLPQNALAPEDREKLSSIMAVINAPDLSDEWLEYLEKLKNDDENIYSEWNNNHIYFNHHKAWTLIDFDSNDTVDKLIGILNFFFFEDDWRFDSDTLDIDELCSLKTKQQVTKLADDIKNASLNSGKIAEIHEFKENHALELNENFSDSEISLILAAYLLCDEKLLVNAMHAANGRIANDTRQARIAPIVAYFGGTESQLPQNALASQDKHKLNSMMSIIKSGTFSDEQLNQFEALLEKDTRLYSTWKVDHIYYKHHKAWTLVGFNKNGTVDKLISILNFLFFHKNWKFNPDSLVIDKICTVDIKNKASKLADGIKYASLSVDEVTAIHEFKEKHPLQTNEFSIYIESEKCLILTAYLLCDENLLKSAINTAPKRIAWDARREKIKKTLTYMAGLALTGLLIWGTIKLLIFITYWTEGMWSAHKNMIIGIGLLASIISGWMMPRIADWAIFTIIVICLIISAFLFAAVGIGWMGALYFFGIPLGCIIIGAIIGNRSK